MRRTLHILLSASLTAAFVLLPGGSTAAAEGATKPTATVNVSQVILPPDCYDIVTTDGPTTDYIAVFDCEYRRP